MTTINGKAEAIVKNANIMTMNTSKPRAQSLAIAHGRFIGVGSNEDVEGLIGPPHTGLQTIYSHSQAPPDGRTSLRSSWCIQGHRNTGAWLLIGIRVIGVRAVYPVVP